MSLPNHLNAIDTGVIERARTKYRAGKMSLSQVQSLATLYAVSADEQLKIVHFITV